MSLEQIGRVLALAPDAISAPERHVLTVLAWYSDADGSRVWPSVATLMRQTSLTRRTVQRSLAGLLARGYAVLEQPSHGQVAAVYRLTLTSATPAPLPAPQSHPRQPDTGATGAQYPRHTVAEGRHTVADPRHTGAQSVMTLHDHQNAGAPARENGAHPRQRGTGAGVAPPSNLYDNTPKFPLTPEAERTARAIRELAERKRMSAAKPAEPSDHGLEPEPGIPH